MDDVHPVPSDGPAKVPPAEVPGLAGLLSLAVAVVVVAALYLGRDVLVPITLAILLSFVLAPIASALRRLQLGRVPSVVVAVLLALGIIAFLGGLIGSQAASLASDIPRYASTIERKLAGLRAISTDLLPAGFSRLGKQLEAAGSTAVAGRSSSRDVATEPKPLPVEVHEPEPSPLEVAGRVLAPIVDPLETTLIVIVVAIFILLQREDLRDRIIRLFGSRDLHRTTTAMDEAGARLSRYFLTQLALNTLFGIIVSIGLYLIGVPSPLLWGVLAALMRFVPYIGAFIAAVPPLALAAAVDPGWSMAIWTVALFAVAEPLMGYGVEPMVYGHSTGLSPVSVVVAAVFWTWLWGPVGLILSTPLTLCLVVLGRHVERLEFLDVLLGDRPALTPVESFYQRMLAEDPDEALDQAEALLKERSLSSYYDEVVVKGLQLAVADAARGALSRKRLLGIRTSLAELIEDLDDYDDNEPAPEASEAPAEPTPQSLAEQALPKSSPPPDRALPAAWQREGAVLCIAGRGTLDESVADMLAQLLGKHGIRAKVVPHRQVSRDRLAELPASPTLMIFLCYVAADRTSSQLRLLVRRLRQHFPGVSIVVGLWSADVPDRNDPALQGSVDADAFVASMREAVDKCLVLAHDGSDLEALIAQIDAPAAMPTKGSDGYPERPVL